MLSFNLVRSILVAALLLAGCGGVTSEEVEAELEGERAAADRIYHFGCTEWEDGLWASVSCGDGRIVCGAEAESELRDRWLAGPEPVFVEWFSPLTIPGVFEHYYAVSADGSAVHYFEKRTDIADSDCGDYCGWHRESVAVFLSSDGRPHIVPSGIEVRALGSCDWP